MINFFHEGSNIGFSLSGVSGFILFIYILIEIFFLIITKTFFIHKLLISTRIIIQIRKKMSKHWHISGISLITINKKSHNIYECYVKVKSKYASELWTNDFIEINRWGTIIKSELFYKMKSYDNDFSDKVKQYNRDKALEQIGI
jgi:hypothetical protein